MNDEPLKVLHISSSDSNGGASIAARRLHNALTSLGHLSYMLVQSRRIDDFKIIGPSNRLLEYISIARPKVDQFSVFRKKSSRLFSVGWIPSMGLAKQIQSIGPDVIHLHWICGGMLRIEELAGFTAPLVCSMHDSWYFTGGCHVRFDCDRYETGCGKCPALNSLSENDLSRKQYRRKQKAYGLLENLSVVAPSTWMADAVRRSPLFAGRRIKMIHNPLDTSVYKPLDSSIAREIWNLPKNKKLILFGSFSPFSDLNKGYHLFLESLKHFDIRDTELVVFGAYPPREPQILPIKTRFLGFLNDEVSMATLYSAADVMVVPSMQESFGQTAAESLACGTPVTCFRTSGLVDIVDHKANGYLADPFHPMDLASGIRWCLDTSESSSLKKFSREKALSKFDQDVIAHQMLDFYKEAIP
jgi:glycosyltransferase involved in cell wall biosynthesis